MNPLFDTLFNIVAFAFIGLMIYLYFKDTGQDDPSSQDAATPADGDQAR